MATKKRESKALARLNSKDTVNKYLIYIRVESNTINGIPDINGCMEMVKSFGMELKSDRVGVSEAI